MADAEYPRPRQGRLPWDRDPWKIAYVGTELEFGTRATGLIFDTAPDLGDRQMRNEDTPLPHADGKTFGQDFVEGRTITFSVTVSGADEDEAHHLLSNMSRVWRADAIRQLPGEVATLTSERGRVLYGRPRRFVSDDEMLPHGIAVVTADFETADDNWYGDEERADINFMPNLGGGLVAPLASPLSTTLNSDRSRAFTIGGDLPTWPIFEITGPIVNPVLEIVHNYKLEFQLSLTSRQTVRIDTRPFARSILRNDASVRGTLSRKSVRLSSAALPPGGYEMVLRGQSAARTASASIRWRNAYMTP